MGRPTTIGAPNSPAGGMSTAPLTAAGDSGLIPVDYRGGPFQLSIAVIISSGTFYVDYTLDDLQGADSQITGKTPPITSANATWFVHPTLTALTVSTPGNIAFPVTGIRLRCTVAGSGYMRVISTPVVGG